MLRLIGLAGIVYGLILLLLVGIMSYLHQSPSTIAWIVYGELVAEDLTSNFYRMLPDGSRVQFLTNIPDFEVHIQFSPDGQWLIYSTTGELCRMRSDGSELYCVVASTGVFFPSYSPDGRWIVFRSDRNGATDIYRMRPDGSNVQQLTDDRGIEQSPIFMPDGDWIVFIRDPNLRSAYRLFRMRSDGTGVHEITQNYVIRVGVTVDHSPDGKWLVFPTAMGELYRIRWDGTALQRLGYGGSPAWSPDGEWIAFWSDRDGGYDIYRMRPDGTEVQRLTHSATQTFNPIWSPIIDQKWNSLQLVVVGVTLTLISAFSPHHRR